MTKNKNLKNSVIKKKEIKKSVNKKIDALESNSLKEVLKVLRLLLIVIIVLGAFYLLTVSIVGNSDDKEKVAETAIQYDEILAGSTFNMKDDTYLVCYFDFSDTELTDLTAKLNSYSYSGKYRLYTVDMSNGFNKVFSKEGDINRRPNTASELTINGSTLIKIADGEVQDYVEGTEAILEYLN